MTIFAIDLWFGYSLKPNRRAGDYAISMGALKACEIADCLGDDSPPRIVVRDYGWGRDGESVVVAEFAATARDEVDAVVATIAKKLGSEQQLRGAILRVPGGSSTCDEG